MAPAWIRTLRDQAGSSRQDSRPDAPLPQRQEAASDLVDPDDPQAISDSVNDVFAHIDDTAWNADGDNELIESARDLSLDAPASHRRINASRTFVDFKKTWLYANSRLPPHLMPLRLYLSSWSIVCLAAQASVDVYSPPGVLGTAGGPNSTRVDHVPASWRAGTKAMTIATKPMTDNNIIVVAIRGSQLTPVDWAVNFRHEPTMPSDFLDDAENACHAGFLQVARAMVKPLAERLRAILQEAPAQTMPNDDPASLVLTGHSAGGAVASLLYMHMQSTTVDSELSYLRPFFRRVHCITFGVPPLSLLPLQYIPRHDARKNLFLSFANEGDPVIRADKVYLRALSSILAAPPPALLPGASTTQAGRRKKHAAHGSSQHINGNARPPYVPIPQSTLSNAGRMVLLRDVPGHHEEVEAVQTTDEDLRGVLFGDPAMHSMVLYKRRVDRIAVKAVTGAS